MKLTIFSKPLAVACLPSHIQAGVGGGGLFLENFIKRILCGHQSISVAVCLCFSHICWRFGKNRPIDIGDIE